MLAGVVDTPGINFHSCKNCCSSKSLRVSITDGWYKVARLLRGKKIKFL